MIERRPLDAGAALEPAAAGPAKPDVRTPDAGS
jgi:hypothetical protein